ncbi:MAG: S8 family serine peptidase, partial [Candidatus Nitrosotenuis sp.]
MKQGLVFGVLFSLVVSMVFSSLATNLAEGVFSNPATNSQITPKFAQNSIIVAFKVGMGKQQMSSFYNDHKANYGLSEAESIRTDQFGRAIKLVKTGLNVDYSMIENLNHDPRISYVEPNYILTVDDIATTDTYRGQLWGLENTGQSIDKSNGTPGDDIDAPSAWTITRGSYNTVVGIIDTGIDYNHEDLVDNVWTNPGEIPGNGIDDDNNGYVDDIHGWNAITSTGNPMDDDSHGTHVAGTIGAMADNGKGVVGVNHQVKIVACKFLDLNGNGYTGDAVKCFDYF